MSGRGETNVRAIVHEIKKIPQNSPGRQSASCPPTQPPHTRTHFTCSPFSSHTLSLTFACTQKLTLSCFPQCIFYYIEGGPSFLST